jgi:16S rRNA (uracil1498-N3)-methyltransferase
MKAIRIYHPQAMAAGDDVILLPAAAHHVARVLRMLPGDDLVLFNGQGGEFHGVLLKLEKNKVTVNLQCFDPVERESPLWLHLGQGISRGDKMDFTLQKAVELGVSEITPLLTERCGVRLDSERLEKKLAHWQAVIISACEQSGRNRIPLLLSPQEFTPWVLANESDLSVVLSPTSTLSLTELPQQGQRICLVVGPEGGLTDYEINFAVANKFIAINLGPRILRTETAALATLAAMQCHLNGDF